MRALVQTVSLQLRRLRKMPMLLRVVGGTIFIFATFTLLMQFPAARPESPYIAFLPVILLIGLLFDHGTTVLATGLAAVLSIYFLIDPYYSLTIARPGDVIGLGFFIGTALAGGGIIEMMRHAVEELAKSNVALSSAVNSVAAQGRLLDVILEGTPDLIYVKDVEGRFVHLNMAAAQVLGAPDAAAARGRRDRDFLDPAQAQLIEAVDARVISSGDIETAEEVVTSPDLGTRVYLSTKAPWFDSDGTIHGLIGVSRDVTERNAAVAALSDANAQKQLLLFDINHRVKNHLQSIVGLLSLAAARITDVDGARTALRAAATRLVVLGKVYTKLQIGIGSASAVEVRGFVEELCGDLASSIADPDKVSISVDIVDGLINSDKAVTLGLIVNELVQNALKYAFPGDATGCVHVRLANHGGAHQLTVDDDGVGLKTANRDGGAGQLLVRALVSQLNGQIEVSGSTGTRFTITLPALAAGIAD